MAVAVIAEKPSVARDIAHVLGAQTRGEGLLRGGGYVVTWAIGHLVALAQPHEIRPEWKRWTREHLPLLPDHWPLVVLPDTQKQFDVVASVLADPVVERVVCATDAGREGELIFRYLYEKAGCRKPVERLWLSSLTPDAIKQAFSHLRRGEELDHLADAARGRSRADWLVGMNLSRATTLGHDEMLHVGRVQTPTLAMLAEREHAIRSFVPEDYVEVVATFGAEGARYRGTWFRPPTFTPESRRLPSDGAEAKKIIARAKAGRAKVESVTTETRHIPPPLLYDLTDLQRHANRLYGMSAKETLAAAQSLYEQRKLLSYPRTDSRHLSSEVAATLPAVVKAVSSPYAGLLAPGTGERPLSRRFVDDTKVTDHHALIPTAMSSTGALSPAEQRIYDLVCRRLLMAWHGEHVFGVTTVLTRITAPAPSDRAGEDRYHASGTTVTEPGWKALEPPSPHAAGPQKARHQGEDAEDAQALPPGLAPGQGVDVLGAEAVAKRTRPPRRFTDATLLTAMETAGRTLDDRELAEAMKGSGLGTPATRAEIIETLLRRGYVERQARALLATEKGIRLIERVHPDVKSPALTAEWEAQLGQIERGQADLASFMRRIEEHVSALVAATLGGAPAVADEPRAEPDADEGDVVRADVSRRKQMTEASTSGRHAPADEGARGATAPPARARTDKAVSPARGDPLLNAPGDGAGNCAAADERSQGAPAPRMPSPSPSEGERVAVAPRGETPRTSPAASGDLAATLQHLLRSAFRLEEFRPRQEAVCRALAEGKDVLLVMPTGAGKSLCYQLPALARQGTALVISPLIALMEDQVAKLQALGLRAERIHSGRERSLSQKALAAYLDGRLDFLFVAPERLGVPGFPEALSRRAPALVAVDEAHCISEWGHDFRPDYRRIGGHLPRLRPAPVIALTATATPRVQDDIAAQLGLAPQRFIHGFRRDNIAVEVARLLPSLRGEAVRRLLADPARRPAIVYAPTRREADTLGAALATAGMTSAAYHAGMAAGARERVQADFLAGRLDVIVATVAFGMGIDKADIRTVIHTALPGTLEGFSQEIGRAGRDGRPSRAVLLHSWNDRRTHEFFHEKSYPDPEVLSRVFRLLGPTPRPVDELASRGRIDAEELETALEKLWIHGGARLTADHDHQLATRGSDEWLPPYRRQREHRREQLDLMQRYADGHACRMVALVRHFGDREDSGAPCGTCDVCAPEACVIRSSRAPTPAERAAAGAVLTALRDRDGQATGRLHTACGSEGVDRRVFEEILGGLVRSGILRVTADTFEKEGKTIPFQRAWLTREGKGAAPASVDFTMPEGADTLAGSGPKKRKGHKPERTPSSGTAEPGLVSRLKEWRLTEARKAGVPAFRVLHDRTLLAIAAARPQDEEALLGVTGIGPALLKRYGTRLLVLCRA